MKNILFGITNLNMGGAERVLVDICNKLCDDYNITIFTLYAKGDFKKHLSDRIKVKSLYDVTYESLSSVKRKLISLRIMFFKKNIYNKFIKGNYDTEIAFLEGPITNLFSVKNAKIKKIAWVHTDITKIFGSGIKAYIHKLQNKKVYKKYNQIIFVSNTNKETFEKAYNIPVKKDVIYNYVNKDDIIQKSNKEVSIKKDDMLNFVVVARLVQAKALDRLAKVHSKLIKEGIMHRIYIVGDGPLQKKLQDIINELDIKDTFILLGKKDNPYPYIKNADCIALVSYYEGLPMTLLEAKVLNKFILITDNSSKEALLDYENCMVVENTEDGVYQGIKDIVTNKQVLTNETQYSYSSQEILEKIKEIIGD